MILSTEVVFGAGELDRCAEIRKDSKALEALMKVPSTRALVFYRGKALLDIDTMRAALLPLDDALIAACSDEVLFLGKAEGMALFAYNLIDWEPSDAPSEPASFLDDYYPHHETQPANHVFVDIRSQIGQLDLTEAEWFATARGLFEWHRTHGYCARCGAKSNMQEAGWSRICPTCSAPHFPRTDPVVIMLITHGPNVLLGRSPGWPEGMYSCLAGFVEPGESLEAAVKRETFEEAGIKVGDVHYIASQPWPFPASLMIGCKGVATSKDIKLDKNELEDAIWVSAERLANSFIGKDETIKPARKGSIAHYLLKNWLTDRI